MFNFKIHTYKNRTISCQLFDRGSSNVILIIASAMGVKQSFYRGISEFATENGISVITFDYSGIGSSLYGDINNQRDSLYSWGNRDLEAVIKYSIEKFPNHRKVVLGHSVGGQLIGLAPSSVHIDKIILISSQSGFWGFWKGLNKVKMFLNWHLLFPFLSAFLGYMPSKRFSKMENLPKKVAEEWAKWCRNKEYLFLFFSNDQVFFNKIECDLLSISIDDDFFAPKKSVEWLTEKYINADVKKLHLIPNQYNVKQIGHFGFFRELYKETLWKLLLIEVAQ